MRVKLLQTNRMLRLLLCLAVAIMAANGTFAQSVNRATARRVAETFFIQNVKNGESQPVQFEDVTAETEFQNFYIFSADSGFVIVAGDERVIPILGYSKTSPFVTENMPENLRWWLEGYDGQIQEVMDNSIPATAEIATKWSCLKTGEAEPVKGNRSVELPLTTKWDQRVPYNDACPITSEGAQCVTGCVATAIAQVLKYWNYPTQGLGSKTLEATQTFDSVLHQECYPIYVDFSATTYDWQNMDNTLTSSSPQGKIDAVATLMKHCGVAMNMNYGTTDEVGSGSTLFYADSICKYFDYSSCASYTRQLYYSDDEWIAMLKNEIDHSRPVLYGGEGTGGHIFVFYGYSNDKFQVNWGLGGSSDGLYEIGRLNPTIEGLHWEFNLNNEAVLYLMPNNRSLSAPDNVEINYSEGVMHLSWSTVSGAVSYIILRDGSYLAEIEQTYYDDTECFGGNYTYSVIAVSADSHASLPSEEMTINIPYETPTVLSLTANTSENSVLLSWTEPSNALIPFYFHKQPFEESEIKHKNSHAPNNSAITEPMIGVFFNASKMGPNSGKYVTEVDIWVSSNSSFWSGEYYAVGKRHTVNIFSDSQSESISFVPTSPGTKQLILQNPIRIERTFGVEIIIEGAGNDMVFDYLEGAENGSWGSFYFDENGLQTRMPSGHHFIVDLYAKWANELTYNVYRNGVCIGRNLQEPNYTDTNVPAGLCSYYVTTNYFGGESEPSETVSVSCVNCTITATASPTEGGIVSGGGTFQGGATCTLTATANAGYIFSNWSENDSVVSTSENYSFIVTGNRTLVANFVDSSANYTISALASPSDGGTVSGGETYQGGTTCTLTAMANSGYTFTYWTENGEVVSANPTYTFIVTRDRTLVANFVIPSASAYVDLGLPSGTLWATWNVGAASPEGYGDYFSWGETQFYDFGHYQYGVGHSLTKYCNNSDYGSNGYTDNLTTLLPEDDAATANWGNGWRMPTREECNELINNTTNTWTTRNGVNGYLFTASNGASLFLPAAGGRWAGLQYDGGGGYYWSSSLGLVTPDGASFLYFCSDYTHVNIGYNRIWGFSVRAVRASQSSATTYIVTTTPNPVEGGTLTSEQQGQICTVSATANSGYIFTNWTENGTVVSTNASYSFTVTGNRTLVANFVFVGAGSYVDLGLPSGTLWANCNIGANAPEEYGDYFAWGETQQKNAYDWSTYQYCYGHSNTLIKYCNNSQYGYNGYTDNLTMLLPGDDAATTNWGDNWRMPTYEEWMELLNNTTSTWTTLNGINGRLFTASNGASLFLPAAGYFSSSDLHSGNSGYYWSGSLDGTSYAKVLYANSGQMNSDSRFYGQSVRAVRASQTSTTTYIVTAKPNIVGGGTLTNTQQGQRCTVTATSNTGYTFNNWTENGRVVSTNASYSFTVTGNRTLVANFRECSALTNLAVTNNSITSQNATVTWTGSDAGYIVQVMQYQATVFHESFENNGTTLPGGWTSVVGTGDGQWVVKTGDNSSSTGAHAGTYNVSCPHTSRNNTTYLISPAMDLSGTTSARLKFWMINRKWGSDIDECHVYYRVNGGDWNGPLFSTTEEHATWTEIIVPLQGLAANYQIGFMSVDQWGYDLCFDDITVESCSWNTVYSSATSPYTFSGLTPNTTYSVRVLNICENASNVISFTTLDAHTLTTSVSPSASGSIACNPSAVNGVYDHGTQVRLTATANTGYTFKNWTENGAVVSTDASYTITMMGNRTLVANFVDNTANYTISASASLSNGGTVRGEGTYYGGTTCTLMASANDGYSFLNWTENGTVVSTEASYSFVVTGNRTLVANFVEGYLIGDGGDATNNYLPSYSYYKYSLTQQIYTTDEIGTAGLITSIAFYNGGAEKTRTYDMYLIHTNKTIFDSDTDWITVTEADKVFSDSMVMVANDWTVFVLDTPFAYNGTSNLAIIIDDNSGKYTSSPHMACRVFNANGNQAIRVYSDNTNYDPMSPPASYGSGENAALHSVKNQIVFEIMPTYHFVTSGNWSTASNWSSGALPSVNNAVFIDANCILNKDAEVSSLTITPGKTLTLRSNKTLTVTGTLSNTSMTGLVIQDGAQLINSSADVAATLRKSITTHGNASNGWYTIASPMNGMLIAGSNFLTPSFDLYRFNETNLTNEEWENYKANLADFTTFEKGRGYLYANSNSFTPNFTGILNATAVNYSLTCTNRPNDPLSGFNLIGNPFPHKIYKGAGGAIDDVNLASGYYTLTNEGTWQAHTFEDAILPGQGILVKATAPVELTIAKSTEEAFAESGEAKRGAGRLNISVAGDGGDDRAFVYFGQGNDLDKVEDFTQATPKLAIRTEKGNFAIAHIDKESDAVELVFTTPTDGSFILTVDVAWADFKYLHLIDLATGDDIELLSVLRPFDGPQGPQAQEPMSYTFTITEQGGERHFKLLYKLSGEKENQ